MKLAPLFSTELNARGYPSNPQTIGQHVKKRRLDLGLKQIDAARIIGVSPWVLELWERERRSPRGKNWPRIIQFLEYDPRPKPTTPGSWLVWFRDLIGSDQRSLAQTLGIDVRTLRVWESSNQPVDEEAKAKFYILKQANFL